MAIVPRVSAASADPALESRISVLEADSKSQQTQMSNLANTMVNNDAELDTSLTALRQQVEVIASTQASLSDSVSGLDTSINGDEGLTAQVSDLSDRVDQQLTADQTMALVVSTAQSLSDGAKQVDMDSPTKLSLVVGTLNYTAAQPGEVWVTSVVSVLISTTTLSLNGKQVWSKAGLVLISAEPYRLTGLSAGDVVTGTGLATATFYPYK